MEDYQAATVRKEVALSTREKVMIVLLRLVRHSLGYTFTAKVKWSRCRYFPTDGPESNSGWMHSRIQRNVEASMQELLKLDLQNGICQSACLGISGG